MSRKCPECKEAGDRPHLVECSYAPNTVEREEFIKTHAVELVRKLEEKVRRQAKEITQLNNRMRYWKKRAAPLPFPPGEAP